MKTAVVYKSLTGFTKKYAEWIAAELAADLFPLESVEPELMAQYAAVVFGGSLHASGISGFDRFAEAAIGRESTVTAVFATGATPHRPETVAELRRRNLSGTPFSHSGFFYLRGGFDFSRLGFRDRFLMRLLKLKLLLTPRSRKTPDDYGMLAAYKRPVDFTDRSKIAPLVAFVRTRKEQ